MEVNICAFESRAQSPQATIVACAAANLSAAAAASSALAAHMLNQNTGEFRHGSKDHYSPEYLLDHGVILVTINYRLGVLGKLAGRFAAAAHLLGEEAAAKRPIWALAARERGE